MTRQEAIVHRAPPVSRRDAALTVILSGALLAVAWWLNRMAGGATGPLMNFFYLPVLIVAARLSVPSAVAAAIVAGVAAGPLTPLDVQSGEVQAPEHVVLRFLFLLLAAAVVGLFARTSMTEIRERLERRNAAGELKAALDQRQLELHYQPLFELRTGRLAGAEALIRWEHPKRGQVAPLEFIPMAEANGMIIPLGRWVAQAVIHQAAHWRRQVSDDAGFAVAFNVSAAQLHDAALPRIISEALRHTGLPGTALHVEITETAVVRNFTDAVARIQELRALGVSIAIDDFGTGESSLVYLQQFDADILKVDRAFVQDIDSARGQALVTGIVRLANDLGATTVAEGIETEEQADLMRAMGCDLGQGYYYAKPGPPEAIDRILELADAPTLLAQERTGVLAPSPRRCDAKANPASSAAEASDAEGRS